jgi:chromosome segregation ATPase
MNVLAEENERLERDLSALNSTLQSQGETFKAELEQLKVALRSSQDETRTFKSDMSRDKVELNEKQRKISDLEAKIASLNRSLMQTELSNTEIIQKPSMFTQKRDASTITNTEASPVVSSPLQRLTDHDLLIHSHLVSSLKNELESSHLIIAQLKQQKSDTSNLAVDLQRENQKLENEVTRLRAIEKEMEEVKSRYLMTLELLGEKTEQLEDLKNDIAEMKVIYKNQIEELLAKIDSSS